MRHMLLPSENATWVRNTFNLLALIGLTARIFMPGTLTLMLVWFMFDFFWLLLALQTRSPAWFMGFIGGVLNGIALLLNGYKMPVLNMVPPLSNWKAWDNPRVWYLCDVLPLGSSIGDWLIVGGLLAMVISFFIVNVVVAHLAPVEMEFQ